MPPPGPPSPAPPPPPPSARPRFGGNGGSAEWATAASAQGLLSGLQSVATRAYSVGANIGEQIVGGVLSGFGKSGQAISSLVGAALSTGQQLAGTGLRVAGGVVGAGVQAAGAAALLPINLAGGIASAAGGALSGIGGAVSGIAGGVGAIAGIPLQIGGGILSGVGSLIGSVTTAITGLFQKFLDGLTNLVDEVGDAFGAIGELAGTAFQTILSVGSDVISEIRQLGRSVRSVGFQTGVGEQRASSLVNTFNFAGVSPEQLSGTFNSPQAALSIGVRAKILGLPDPTQDPEGFLLAGADAKVKAGRGGLMGALQFNALAGPQLTGAFGDSFGLGRERLERNFSLARKWELPGGTAGASRDIEAGTIAVGALATNIKVALLPIITSLMPAFNKALSWVVEHKDQIVGALLTVGQWIVTKLPEYFLTGASLVLKGAAWFSGTLGSFLTDGFHVITKSLLGNMSALLTGAEQLAGGLLGLVNLTLGLGAMAMQYAQKFANSPLGKTLGNIIPTGQQSNTPASGATPGSTGKPLPPSTSNSSSPASTSSASPSVPQPGTQPSQRGNSTATPSPAGTNYSQLAPGLRATGSIGGVLAGAVGGAAGLVVDVAQDAFNWVAPPGIGRNQAIQKNGLLSNTKSWGAAAFDWGYRAFSGQVGWPGDNSTAPPTNSPNAPYSTPPLPAPSGVPSTGTANPSTMTNGQIAQQMQQSGGNANSLLPQPGRTPRQAFQAGQGFLASIGVGAPNFHQYRQNITDTITSIDKGADTAGNWLKDMGEKERGWAEDIDSMKENLVNELQGLRGDMRENTRVTKEQGDRTAGIIAQVGRSAVGRAAAYIAEDFSSQLNRV